jgi:hypothetical protein
MSAVIAKYGTEPLIREAVDYLVRRGIPVSEMRDVTVRSAFGDFQTITVTLIVQAEGIDYGACGNGCLPQNPCRNRKTGPHWWEREQPA